jgi:hypothetical protein
MIYTGHRFLVASSHGILSASRDEEFTFSWMSGTNWVERTFTADKRFCLLPVSGGTRANYEILETRNGYFEVVFLTPPVGHYATIGQGKSSFERIVEFIAP